MTRPDFGPGDYGQDDPREGDAERAERDQLNREAAEDAREMRDTGWDAAGERAAERAEQREIAIAEKRRTEAAKDEQTTNDNEMEAV